MIMMTIANIEKTGRKLSAATIVGLLLLCSQPLVAEDSAGSGHAIEWDSTATLGGYLAYAERQSPWLQAAYHRWQQSDARSGWTGSLPDPHLTVGYFLESVETRVGPQQKKLGLRQTIPWPGSLSSARNSARFMASAAERSYDAARVALHYRVKSAYYDFYFLGQDIALAEENLALLSFWESILQAKYRVSLTKHRDLIKAQVELGKLEDRLLSLQEQLRPTRAKLRAILNLSADARLAIPRQIETNETELNPERILAAVEENNPDLQALGLMVNSQEAKQRSVSRARLPRFTFGVDYIETGEALNPTMSQSGKDPIMVSLGLSLPIWFGKNKAQVREAEARVKVAQYSLQDGRNNLMLMTEQVLFAHSNALRRVRLYRDGLIPKAEEALNSGYAAYQAGEADFLYLLDAQRELLDLQRRFEQSKVLLETKRAEIEMLVGGKVSAFNDNN